MRGFLFLVLLASFSLASGQEGGKPSSLAKIVTKMVKDGIDTLKFNNESMIIIVKKVGLDSMAVEAYARGLDKDLAKNNAPLSSEFEGYEIVPPIDFTKIKGSRVEDNEW